MEIIFALIVFLVIAAALYTEWYTHKSGIVPMPTLPHVRRAMLAQMPDNPQGEILELGAGWGSTVLALSRQYPNHSIIGYEMAPLPFYVAKIRVMLSRRKNIVLKKSDFYTASFAKAGAVFCYLSFKHMDRLEPKFSAELGTKSVVVSHAFPLPGTKAHTTVTIGGLFATTVYVYWF